MQEAAPCRVYSIEPFLPDILEQAATVRVMAKSPFIRCRELTATPVAVVRREDDPSDRIKTINRFAGDDEQSLLESCRVTDGFTIVAVGVVTLLANIVGLTNGWRAMVRFAKPVHGRQSTELPGK